MADSVGIRAISPDSTFHRPLLAASGGGTNPAPLRVSPLGLLRLLRAGRARLALALRANPLCPRLPLGGLRLAYQAGEQVWPATDVGGSGGLLAFGDGLRASVAMVFGIGTVVDGDL